MPRSIRRLASANRLTCCRVWFLSLTLIDGAAMLHEMAAGHHVVAALGALGLALLAICAVAMDEP